ncbi:DUF1998 domain-containing protein [Streptomyces sp. NPDC001668]|uniref:DUF1998 domain-containing protein n=1 Tax=unclassified Streptomyces TaxID=2593676 RepID=UPI0036ADE4E4
MSPFKALLRAGVAETYGGNPDHLEAVVASMPDQSGGSEIRRRFLVVYDTLPGGTGYPHRLADPATFRDVLVAARHRIDTCPCQCEARCLGESVQGGGASLHRRPSSTYNPTGLPFHASVVWLGF